MICFIYFMKTLFTILDVAHANDPFAFFVQIGHKKTF